MCKLCKDCVRIKHIKKRVKLSLNPLILLVAGARNPLYLLFAVRGLQAS